MKLATKMIKKPNNISLPTKMDNKISSKTQLSILRRLHCHAPNLGVVVEVLFYKS